MTHRVRFWLVLWITAVAWPLKATDEGLLKLAHPDANFMMGIQVSEIARSAVVQAILEEAMRSQGEWPERLRMLGGNPLEGLDEVLVTARVGNAASENNVAKDTLVLIRGAVGAGRWNQLLCAKGCDTETYRDLEVIRVNGDDPANPGYFVALDAEHAALGERQPVLGVIDRQVKETESVFGRRMQEWIERVNSHQIWLAARGPFEQSSPAGKAQPVAAAISKVDGFSLGMTLDREVLLALEVHSFSEQDAQGLYEMVQGLLAMSQMQAQPAEAGAFNLLEHLRLSRQGRVLSASLRVPQAELTKQLKTQVAEHRSQPQNEAAAPRPAPRREGGIRVYGLEPEAVEYPLSPR